jgi:hypothetical protein
MENEDLKFINRGLYLFSIESEAIKLWLGVSTDIKQREVFFITKIYTNAKCYQLV